MTPTTVSGLSQTLPLIADTHSNPSPQTEKGMVSQASGVNAATDSVSASVDTVSLSAQSKLASTDVKKEELQREEAKRKQEKKTAPDNIHSKEPAGAAVAKVQFLYDLKGEVKVQYLDTSNQLIYQVPSELMLQMKEAAMKSDTSVDTKA